MKERKLQIIRGILDALGTLDGGLMAEANLHAAVQAKTTPAATLSDFEERLLYCEAQRWVTGIDGRFGTRKWAITEEGELARRELHQG